MVTKHVIHCLSPKLSATQHNTTKHTAPSKQVIVSMGKKRGASLNFSDMDSGDNKKQNTGMDLTKITTETVIGENGPTETPTESKHGETRPHKGE